MKVSTFLALSAIVISATVVYANVEPSENPVARPLRSSPANKDLLALPSLKAAKHLMTTKEIIDARYKKLAKAQKKQRIAERKERIECQKKIKMIANIPGNVDTLNVAKYMQIMFMYPASENLNLTKAIIAKTTSLQKEKGPRKNLNDAERKSDYIMSLDSMFYDVNYNAKKWELDQYGQRQVVTSARPHVKDVFTAQKPKTRQFARKIKVWSKVNSKLAAAAA